MEKNMLTRDETVAYQLKKHNTTEADEGCWHMDSKNMKELNPDEMDKVSGGCGVVNRILREPQCDCSGEDVDMILQQKETRPPYYGGRFLAFFEVGEPLRPQHGRQPYNHLLFCYDRLKRFTNISLNADRLLFDLFRTIGFAKIDAGV